MALKAFTELVSGRKTWPLSHSRDLVCYGVFFSCVLNTSAVLLHCDYLFNCVRYVCIPLNVTGLTMQ